MRNRSPSNTNRKEIESVERDEVSRENLEGALEQVLPATERERMAPQSRTLRPRLVTGAVFDWRILVDKSQ